MLTILHTNDFHNHLTLTQAQGLQAKREALGDSGLLLDAGDAVASGNVTYRSGGETVFDLLNLAGYDAMTVGNREFHLTRRGFHSKVGRANFSVLCANVRRSGQTEAEHEHAALAEATGERAEVHDPPVLPYQVFERDGGKRILVIGVTVPMITPRMLARKVSAYVFDDPIVTVARLLPELRARLRPDLSVALTHIGIGRDRELAQAVTSLDLIVGGHTHVRLENGERVGETLLVQADCFGHALGRVTVEWPSEAEPKVETPEGAAVRPRLVSSLEPL